MSKRTYRYYDWVMAAFVTVLLCANLIGPAKVAHIGPVTFGAGVLFFPISYIFGDILTGLRAGEGYFSNDMKHFVYAAEREKDSPFYQIYLMSLETGDVTRVSPGFGKTSCAYFDPRAERVIVASSHLDPNAVQKQKEELELRASGKQRRYAWDYDEHYELYAWNQKTGAYTKLTNTRGYDAEGSWSPDGRLIAFTSNRSAYTGPTTDEQKRQFELDPAYMNDIYLMDAVGGEPPSVYPRCA